MGSSLLHWPKANRKTDLLKCSVLGGKEIIKFDCQWDAILESCVWKFCKKQYIIKLAYLIQCLSHRCFHFSLLIEFVARNGCSWSHNCYSKRHMKLRSRQQQYLLLKAKKNHIPSLQTLQVHDLQIGALTWLARSSSPQCNL